MLRFGLITFILFGIGVLLLLFVNTSSSSASDVSEYGIRERNLITAFPTRAVSESQNTLDSPENVPKKV